MPEVRGRNWDSSSAFAGAVNGRWPCEVLQPLSACRFSEGRGTCSSVGCAGGLVRREVAIGFELLLPGLGFSKGSCSGRFFVGAVSSEFSVFVNYESSGR